MMGRELELEVGSWRNLSFSLSFFRLFDKRKIDIECPQAETPLPHFCFYIAPPPFAFSADDPFWKCWRQLRIKRFSQ
jgi:hypothetical protein